jgi:hypothetical protein
MTRANTANNCRSAPLAQRTLGTIQTLFCTSGAANTANFTAAVLHLWCTQNTERKHILVHMSMLAPLSSSEIDSGGILHKITTRAAHYTAAGLHLRCTKTASTHERACWLLFPFHILAYIRTQLYTKNIFIIACLRSIAIVYVHLREPFSRTFSSLFFRLS